MAAPTTSRPSPDAEATASRRPAGVTWLRRLAPAALAIGVVWAVAPEAIRATWSSPGTFARVAAVAVALGLWSYVIGRFVTPSWLARVVALVPILAVSWWALSPYIGDDRVDEAFPVVAADPQGAPDSTAGADPAEADASEPGATAAPTTVAPAASDETAPPTTATAPAEPVATHAGTFQGLTGHRGDGNATIYTLADGSRVVRLEDFDVSNGPGLEIHLVPGDDQRGPGGGVKLGDLKGNVGNQNYDVPDDLVLDGTWTVLIWCEPFTVEVANATVTPT